MSAVLRYRTLVNSVGKIYASDDTERTQLLQDGLDEIVSAIGPENAFQWKLVKADSERLLNVWCAKENVEAAGNVVAQLVDILNELASTLTPTLVVSDDSITHVHDRPVSVKVSVPMAVAPKVVLPAAPKVVLPVHITVEKEEAEEEEEVEEEEEEEEVEEEEAEVEQITIRGRTYWIDTNTKKLYANVADEVGDEVGAMINGKAVFLSA